MTTPPNFYTLERFMLDIMAMNKMYELPINTTPKPPTQQELIDFYITLSDELKEILTTPTQPPTQSPTDSLVPLADVLADIVVYCFSQALKHGLNIDEHLRIVMASNFSKLGPDGQPIKNEQGKFLKGPNYFPPEPKLKEEIESYLCQEE